VAEELALLIDFGSTFTKVTAVDLRHARIVARAQSPSTVLTDVCIGLLSALERLHEYRPIFKAKPKDLSALDGFFVRASSSAAGGLRIVVIGLVPGLTVEAANAAALGAGGKIVGTFAFKLGERQIAEIAALKPDIILLTGGTDGGDSQTIVHNGALLAASPLSVPFVVAGNRRVAEQVRDGLTAAGKEACCADNVMPTAEEIVPQAAQGEIRRFFMRRIIESKGLDKVQSLVHIVLPTPMAVLKAAELGAQGTAEHPGWGELLMVDVGGATTDVYSIGDGRQTELDTIPKGLPEPFAKRTVEGDLGIRSNAATILKRVGADGLYAQFTALFPEHPASRGQVLDYVASLNDQPDRVPVESWQSAADATLARLAVDLAIERHVGRKEPYYSAGGTIFLQTGKDLTETPTLVGTGGVFTYNAYANRILAGGVQHRERYDVLRPEAPSVVLDRNYILYSIGLLADSHPQVALQIFQDQLVAGHAVGPVPGSAAGEIVGHGHGHGAGHECC
jgi:uncharacterized protein (TIGR01319 family)